MGDVCPLSVDGIVDRLYDSPVYLCKADCDTPGMAAVACAAINEVLEKQAEPADEDMKRQHTIRCFMLDQKLGFAKEIRLGDVRASWATDSHWVCIWPGASHAMQSHQMPDDAHGKIECHWLQSCDTCTST